MSLEIDYLLWGMDPRGYHLTNILIQAANGALIYMMAMRLLPKTRDGSGFMAVAASLLFAVHPLRVESVAWITERRDVLSLLFLLIRDPGVPATRRGRQPRSVVCRDPDR